MKYIKFKDLYDPNKNKNVVVLTEIEWRSLIFIIALLMLILIRKMWWPRVKQVKEHYYPCCCYGFHANRPNVRGRRFSTTDDSDHED